MFQSVFELCVFIQEFELRKHARQEGRRYCDPVVLTYQAERMPEQIRLKVQCFWSYFSGDNLKLRGKVTAMSRCQSTFANISHF